MKEVQKPYVFAKCYRARPETGKFLFRCEQLFSILPYTVDRRNDYDD